jgi:hypothetical protein
MTDYHIRAHSSVKAVGTEKEKILEVPYPAGTMEGVAFEEVGFRHLKREYFGMTEGFSKVVIINADGRRRVVKEGGSSIEPRNE